MNGTGMNGLGGAHGIIPNMPSGMEVFRLGVWDRRNAIGFSDITLICSSD